MCFQFTIYFFIFKKESVKPMQVKYYFPSQSQVVIITLLEEVILIKLSKVLLIVK